MTTPTEQKYSFVLKDLILKQATDEDRAVLTAFMDGMNDDIYLKIKEDPFKDIYVAIEKIDFNDENTDGTVNMSFGYSIIDKDGNRDIVPCEDWEVNYKPQFDDLMKEIVFHMVSTTGVGEDGPTGADDMPLIDDLTEEDVAAYEKLINNE